MAATDDAIAKVQAAIEAAQVAAANLAAAVGELPEKAVAALPDQVAGVANTATDQATSAINVAQKNFLDMAFAIVAFALVGFMVAFAPNHGMPFGADLSFVGLGALDSWQRGFFVFQVMFCGTAATSSPERSLNAFLQTVSACRQAQI